ncbi:MAG: DUF4188 domain-containing protein [Acidobacteriota bacterium]|nr:DUF4188 domain-containing protein [Acidobacteriota bacterium]
MRKTQNSSPASATHAERAGRASELGCLGGRQWFGNPTILVQYWKSFEALQRFAKDPDLQHLPACASESTLPESADRRLRRGRAGDERDVVVRVPFRSCPTRRSASA